MKTFIEIEVLKIEPAKDYKGTPPKHKSELVYLDRNHTQYGEEVNYKKLKSMLSVEEHKLGLCKFEITLFAYVNDKNRAEISIKVVKQVK